MKPDPLDLTMTRYNVVARPYAVVRRIMAEFDDNEKRLRDALRIGHGIDISPAPGAVNMLYFIIDEPMKKKLAEYKIDSPTWLQLLGTSRCIGTSKKDAEDKFRAMLTGE